MPYVFTGYTSRLYTQYTDTATGMPLEAFPGQSYDMTPVGPFPLPVPPGDGNWQAPAPPALLAAAAPGKSPQAAVKAAATGSEVG